MRLKKYVSYTTSLCANPRSSDGGILRIIICHCECRNKSLTSFSCRFSPCRPTDRNRRFLCGGFSTTFSTNSTLVVSGKNSPSKRIRNLESRRLITRQSGGGFTAGVWTGVLSSHSSTAFGNCAMQRSCGSSDCTAMVRMWLLKKGPADQLFGAQASKRQQDSRHHG